MSWQAATYHSIELYPGKSWTRLWKVGAADHCHSRMHEASPVRWQICLEFVAAVWAALCSVVRTLSRVVWERFLETRAQKAMRLARTAACKEVQKPPKPAPKATLAQRRATDRAQAEAMAAQKREAQEREAQEAAARDAQAEASREQREAARRQAAEQQRQRQAAAQAAERERLAALERRQLAADAVGRELLAEGGLPALFRGLGPRLIRIPIYTAITLATFDYVKDAFQAANALNGL